MSPAITDAWLTIIGIGDDGLAGIGAAARMLIDNAEVLIGGNRHLALVPGNGKERLPWPSPLQTLIDEIERRRNQNVCILATGDPMFYGIGVTLAKRIPIAEMHIIPAPSAFSLACSRLGWALADVDCLTLHGRPLDLVHSFLQPGAQLLILSHDGTTPNKLANRLVTLGFKASRFTVLEHIGGRQEKITENTAGHWDSTACADFNTIAIQVVADKDTAWLSRSPGLVDTAFRHDGQLSKQEVRAVTLAKLQPAAHHLLWDVGAGCGSIAIEWLRAARNSRALAVEKHPSRIRLIAQNASALGVSGLEILHDSAPAALHDLKAPDAVFIGGGISEPDMLETCWRALKEGGRLVANAVTLDGEAILMRWQREFGGEFSRIAISRAEPIGNKLAWRALRPVTQFAVHKS